MIQGSPEWIAARLGKVTASRMADVLAKTKTGWGASRANYMAELIAERLTGIAADSYTNAAMKWGVETEPQARAAYQFHTDVEVEECGFINHGSIPMAGASPDGLVGSDGLVEIKCPNTATHIDTLLGASVPSKYLDQMAWQIICAGRTWCDFVSFDPRMPPALRLFVVRYYPLAKAATELESAVIQFLAELNDRLAALKAIA